MGGRDSWRIVAANVSAMGFIYQVPPTRPLHAEAEGEDHRIDEWWDYGIGDYLRWLFSHRYFDAFVVNYPYRQRLSSMLLPMFTAFSIPTIDLQVGDNSWKQKASVVNTSTPPKIRKPLPCNDRI